MSALTWFCVYRHFDESGVLLYVGASPDPMARLLQLIHDHVCWVDEITNITIERFPSRQEALRAERQAIEDEAPLYNRVHNRKNAARIEEKLRRSPDVEAAIPAAGDVEQPLTAPERARGIEIALAEAGGMRQLATKLGISHAAISRWRTVPIRQIEAIERELGIPRHILRPDVYRHAARKNK